MIIARIGLPSLGISHDSEVTVTRILCHMVVDAGMLDSHTNDRMGCDIWHSFPAVINLTPVFEASFVLFRRTQTHVLLLMKRWTKYNCSFTGVSTSLIIESLSHFIIFSLVQSSTNAMTQFFNDSIT